MSIMEKLFGAKPATPAPAPTTPQNPTNNLAQSTTVPSTPATPGTDQNGVVPPGGAEPPMDKFKDLWQPTKTDPNNPGEQSNSPAPVDPQKLMEAAARADFSSIVTSDMMQKIAEGGEGAAAAFVQALKGVYGQSAVTTAKIVEQAVSQAREDFIAEIPNHIRKQNVRGRVFEENPAFSNPAIAPLIEAQVQQLASKFPKATPSELNTMAKEYLQGMAALISPPKADVSGKRQTGKEETDWDAYLN